MKAGRPGRRVLVIVGRVTKPDGIPTTGVILPSVPVMDEVKGTEPNGSELVTTGARLNA